MDSDQKNDNRLGIIAGSGLLPGEIAKIYEEIGGDYFIADISGETGGDSIFDEITSPSKENFARFSIGSVGKILDFFKSNNVKQIILIGKIKRPNFSTLKVDFIGSKLLTKILGRKIRGDDNILRIIADFIENQGIEIISPISILNKVGYLNNLPKITTKPTKQDKIDIELGIKALDALSEIDVGQSIIVENSCVIGIEAMEGTDQLIERCNKLKSCDGGGILIKKAKITQDLRLDTPAIGVETVKKIIKNGYRGLAIEKDTVIIIEAAKVTALLNENRILLHWF